MRPICASFVQVVRSCSGSVAVSNEFHKFQIPRSVTDFMGGDWGELVNGTQIKFAEKFCAFFHPGTTKDV